MKEIIKTETHIIPVAYFVADDGTEFKLKTDCERYEEKQIRFKHFEDYIASKVHAFLCYDEDAKDLVKRDVAFIESENDLKRLYEYLVGYEKFGLRSVEKLLTGKHFIGHWVTWVHDFTGDTEYVYFETLDEKLHDTETLLKNLEVQKKSLEYYTKNQGESNLESKEN